MAFILLYHIRSLRITLTVATSETKSYRCMVTVIRTLILYDNCQRWGNMGAWIKMWLISGFDRHRSCHIEVNLYASHDSLSIWRQGQNDRYYKVVYIPFIYFYSGIFIVRQTADQINLRHGSQTHNEAPQFLLTPLAFHLSHSFRTFADGPLIIPTSNFPGALTIWHLRPD